MESGDQEYRRGVVIGLAVGEGELQLLLISHTTVKNYFKDTFLTSIQG